MTEQPSAATRRKTEQAIKISATWTPGQDKCHEVEAFIFGDLPLRIRGGRLTINAAILTDHADPSLAARVAERIAELKRELEAIGTLHAFSTQAGSVPVGTAERLPPLHDEESASGGDGLVGEAAA